MHLLQLRDDFGRRHACRACGGARARELVVHILNTRPKGCSQSAARFPYLMPRKVAEAPVAP